MKLVLKCIPFLLAALMAGCTEETQNGGDNKPSPGETDSGQRREVLLTLKNKLALKKASTKADDPIATAEENTISTLDIYVFASGTEGGEYTFQERFAYRADGSKLPEGASELELTPGKDETQTTGLLNLKKGLFAKLYCVANQPTLVDPAHEDQTLADAAFVPLTFTKPGEQGTQIATPGQPKESEFLTFHTLLLNAEAKADTLCTPLAMSGAYTTPIDLTDFNSSARVQAGFKLTRLAARFDIVNKAEESRFSIETVSMGNGRRGTTLFPIRIYGQTPDAQTDELITYPFKAFYGDNANTGTQTGAFYSYPSPLNDKGYMILKGKYQVNKTESKEVSYQIPFAQTGGNGNETSLEINNNHRYTIAITKADDYHLDFTLTVADWADDGSIEEYKPDGETGDMKIDIPIDFKGETNYTEDTKTISMSLKKNSKFEVTASTNAALTLYKNYAGGLDAQQYDWLEVSEQQPVSKASTFGYTYTFSQKEGYTKGRYPKAVLRFTNTMNGNETVLYVTAVSVPQADETQQTGEKNPNSFDAENLLVSMYRTTGSNARVRITCPDGIETESKPDWLDITVASQNGAETVYSLTLNNRDVTGVTENKGTVTFRNKKDISLQTDITVQLLDAALIPDFTKISGNNTFTAADGDTPANITMRISEGNTFTLPCQSMQGIKVETDFGDGPEWLANNGVKTRSTLETSNLVFTQVKEKLGGAKTATVTIKNNVGGKDLVFTVTPGFQAPTVTRSGGLASNTLTGTEVVLYKCPTDKALNSTISFRVVSGGGCKIAVTGGMTVTATTESPYTTTYTVKMTYNASQNNGTITLSNAQDLSKKTTLNVTIKTIPLLYPGTDEIPWEYGSFYVAPITGGQIYREGPAQTACPTGWRLPMPDELRTEMAKDSQFARRYCSNGLGTYKGYFWTGDVGYSINSGGSIQLLRGNEFSIRCVHDR